MGILNSIFGGRTSREPAAPQPSREARLETLSGAVRETLRSHGIPAAWIGAEALPARTPSEHKGVHLRLVVRNATPKLLAHVHALERAIHARLLQVDAESTRWLTGTSWRIEAPLGSDHTELPGPAFWQPARQLQAAGAAPRPNARELLAQTVAKGDRAFARTTWEAPEFSPTQPMVR